MVTPKGEQSLSEEWGLTVYTTLDTIPEYDAVGPLYRDRMQQKRNSQWTTRTLREMSDTIGRIESA